MQWKGWYKGNGKRDLKEFFPSTLNPLENFYLGSGIAWMHAIQGFGWSY